MLWEGAQREMGSREEAQSMKMHAPPGEPWKIMLDSRIRPDTASP